MNDELNDLARRVLNRADPARLRDARAAFLDKYPHCKLDIDAPHRVEDWERISEEIRVRWSTSVPHDSVLPEEFYQERERLWPNTIFLRWATPVGD